MPRGPAMDSLLGALLASVLCAASAAAWPNSPLVNVPVCVSAGTQSVGSVVSDGLGGMIVVWYDARGVDDDIYAQRIDAAGVPQWTANGVPVCTLPGHQLDPRAVSDGAGGAFLVWKDYRAGSIAHIYAQRLGPSGASLWADNGVAVCTAARGQALPSIVPDGQGGAIMAWADSRVSGTWEQYAQRLDANGNALWTTDGVAITTGLAEVMTPQIAPDDSGGVIAAWHQPTPSVPHPRVQRLGSDGARRWAAAGVTLANVSSQVSPVIASDGANGAIVVWHDYRAGNALTTSLFAQRVSSTGAPQWASGGIALTNGAGDQRDAAIAADGAGGAVMLWRNDSTTALCATRVDAAGARLWPIAGVVVCSHTGQHFAVPVASDGAGGMLVSWSDDRVGSGDIYTQRIAASGVPLWTADGVATCTAAFVASGARAIADGAGGALVAWSDFRSGTSYDVYAQNVRASGVLGGSTLDVGAPAGRAMLAIRIASALPARGDVWFECALAGEGDARIAIVDVAGRQRASVPVSGGSSGVTRVAWKIAPGMLESGVYFARLEQAGRSTTTRFVVAY